MYNKIFDLILRITNFKINFNIKNPGGWDDKITILPFNFTHFLWIIKRGKKNLQLKFLRFFKGLRH